MEIYKQNGYKQATKDDILSALKPIETRYNGYRFRSRTEARWAVLFDSLGIKYDYEPEGYELIFGPYLPDFWLPYPDDLNFSGYPNAGHWVEVKGPEPTQAELSQLLHLSIATKHSGHLLWGTPWNFQRYFTNRHGACFWCRDIDEISCESNAVKAFLYRFIPSTQREILLNAIAKSKSARFEHGEKG